MTGVEEKAELVHGVCTASGSGLLIPLARLLIVLRLSLTVPKCLRKGRGTTVPVWPANCAAHSRLPHPRA